jgi:hypothetical protein
MGEKYIILTILSCRNKKFYFTPAALLPKRLANPVLAT